ncbi:ABC transporter permease [Enterovirga rhinocerotis]|uniref:Putative spermidine/putrescine transport system permease protein n=1 Tax=Enterovirga rhinocerotis TaxID=1339210 RepID=A0A4R7BWG9_9HYPH|nr:ABC transporter permease [Enterovirga rhinocerotis]TDR90220.1 putative spermidine/putrescine transport system permease protein [Enterovirga rhinocerotis]
MRTSLPVRILAALVLVFLPAPLIIVIGASFSPGAVLSFPPPGFSLRWYGEVLGDHGWVMAFVASAGIAAGAAVVTTIAALGAALALEHASPRTRSIAETMILAPLLFPHAALGIAFLSWLVALHANGTMIGVFVSHVILCAPFAYRPIAVSLHQIDRSVAEAAEILGASPWRTITTVLIPMLRPGLAAALMFSFIISFDEVTVTMFLVGPEFSTLPVKIYGHLADSADPVVAAISTILIAMTGGMILLLDRVVGLGIFVDIEEDARGNA